MKTKQFVLSTLLLAVLISCNSQPEGKHVFILSGQSNMARLKLEESFTPTIEKQFKKENVVIVKDAKGGQPIRRWVKNWKPIQGDEPSTTADLYDSLMKKVFPVLDTINISSITFVWMQGERDARESLGEVYERSLLTLYAQLQDDLHFPDINFVIGRLSDFDMDSSRYPDWTNVRNIQVKVGESHPRFGWVNTDDLNDGINRTGKEIKDDLHMSANGYITLGKRFAEKSIELINK